MTIRCALLVGSPKIGGAERQVRHLATGLRAAGSECAIYFMEREGRREASSCFDFSEIPNHFLGAGRGRDWWARRRLAQRLSRDRVDVLFAFNRHSIAMAATVVGGPRPGVALVASVRGLGFQDDPWETERLRRACERAVLVTCNSAAIQRALIAARICEAARLRLLPNVVTPAGPARERGRGGEFVVLFAANLVEVKRPLLFVGACRRAMQETGRFRVLVVGQGPLEPAMVEATGSDRAAFEFLGHLPADRVPYAEASVVVNTSVREGTSNALLEGMAHGVPAVATAAGGNVDLIEDSGGGLLVESADVEDIAAALVRMHASQDARREMGERGRAYVQRVHRPESVIGRLQEIAAEARGLVGHG